MAVGANTAKNTARRNLREPWKPGQSGNPNGRPKVVAEFREWCRGVMEHGQGMTESGKARLLSLIAEGGMIGYLALKLAAEYAYGKPPQRIDVTHGYRDLTDEEIEARIQALDADLGRGPRPPRGTAPTH